MMRVAAGATRSVSPAWASMRWSASSAVDPRPTSRSRWIDGSHSTSQTSSHRAASPPSTSRIASTTTASAPWAAAPSIVARIRGRTAGWTIASRSRNAAGSANTTRPSAARSSDPSARSRSDPNRAMTASSAGSPGSRTSRATTSASMTTTPGRSPSHPATVDFPQPMGPVIPIRSGRACSVDCSRVMAGV